jgi:molecular chaperone GrpE (heat shock protein)
MLASFSKNLMLSSNLKMSLLSGTRATTAAFMSTETAKETNSSNGATDQAKEGELAAQIKTLEEKLAKSEASSADFKDRYMRALAETENVRVRMNKLVEDAKVFGIQGIS